MNDDTYHEYTEAELDAGWHTLWLKVSSGDKEANDALWVFAQVQQETIMRRTSEKLHKKLRAILEERIKGLQEQLDAANYSK